MLTPSQKTALKADITVNSNIATRSNGEQFVISSRATSRDADDQTAIANWYNQSAAPAYWCWRTAVSRAEIYNKPSDIPSNWDWTFYKNQNVTEQNAWVQMFMSDQADFSQQNLRTGIGNIFTAGSVVNRNHAYAIGRRQASNLEKLFAVAVAPIVPNTGNDGVPANRGKATNPDLFVVQETINQGVIDDVILNR